ncbi:MAG TPA: hypothetical protein VHA56_07315 [Mucilaginibacter sp.]|nr:hypothetical protein [Mucilaginibacter sp.]
MVEFVEVHALDQRHLNAPEGDAVEHQLLPIEEEVEVVSCKLWRC